MKEQLIIQLSDSNQDAVYWGLWSQETNQWLEFGELLPVDLIALAERSQKHHTVVIAPATQAPRKEVTTPARQLKQIRKAVPYMMEDLLATPVEQLHFAYGKKVKDGKVEVCWINKDQLKSWFRWFEQAELSINAIYSELELLTESADAKEVFLNDHNALVIEQDGKRWCCQRDLLEDFLEFDEEGLDVNPIRLFYMDELEDKWVSNEQIITQAIDEREYLAILAQRISLTKINLMQGEFEAKKEVNLQWMKYRNVAALAIISLVLHLSYQGSQYYLLSAKNDQYRAEAEQLFKTVFAKKPRSSSLLSQIKRLTRNSSKGKSGSEFLALMLKMSEKIDSTQEIKPTSINFDGKRGELKVDVLAKDMPALNGFRDILKSAGLSVEMSSANAQGTQFSSRLNIRSGS